MAKKSKIVMVTECPYSGVLQAVVQHARLLSSMGFSIYFVLPKTPNDRYGETVQENIRILEQYGTVIRAPLRRQYSSLYSDIRSLKKVICQFDQPIVISYAGYAGKVCRFLYKMGCLDVLYHVPQCIDGVRRPLVKRVVEHVFETYLAPHASRYIACSKSESETLSRRYAVPESNIAYVPNHAQCVPSTKKVLRRDFVIVGRVTADKRVKEVLEVAKKVGLLSRITVIGSGSMLETVKKMYPEALCTGRVMHETVYSYLERARFIISDSIIEGLPFAILEAMACGVIPLVSRVPGHSDIVKDGVNGFLFGTTKELQTLLTRADSLSKRQCGVLSSNAKKTAYALEKISKAHVLQLFSHYE